MTMVPWEVVMVATYRLVVSMIIGGSSSNLRCCGLEPSASGGVGVAMAAVLAFVDGEGGDALGDIGRDPVGRTLRVDRTDDAQAGRHLTEEGVRVGQGLALRPRDDEELAAARVGLARVGHHEGSQRILLRRVRRLGGELVRDGVAGLGAGVRLRRITGLEHEARDDAEEAPTVEV